MRLRSIPIACGAALLAASTSAQMPVADPSIPMDEIVVSGDYAGPGLWRVTRDADSGGHTLWIIGDPPPLPKRLAWRSAAV